MLGRLRDWLRRPAPDAAPSETLRWVRRLEIAVIPMAVLVWLQVVALAEAPVWLGVVFVAVSVIVPFTLGPSIRRAEEREADPAFVPAPPDVVRKRQRRGAVWGAVIQVVTVTVVGLVPAGYPGVFFFTAFGLLMSGLTLWMARRMERGERG